MKPRAFNLLAVLLPCLLAVTACQTASAEDPAALRVSPGDAPPVAEAGKEAASESSAPPPAAASASPSATPKPNKKPKGPPDPNATPKPPKIKKPKDIPFPLPINDSASHIVIPENGITGNLLMQLMAIKATRISNEFVQMQETHVDLNHPDGKEDFHIDLPACLFNLQTRMITSEQPVTVHTQDFELTGEKMEFNTVDRTGKLLGRVHMHIHNLKQVAGLQKPPAP